jgi:prevent-host-death family protein
MEVGVRELRADLSRWIKRVQAGEDVLVTDRGKPVARLVPANGRSKLEELIAAGLARQPRRKTRRPLPPLIKASGSVSELLGDDRR